MTSRYPDVVPVIERWLSQNHERICSFWIGAEWNMWARYELFMCLDAAFDDKCVVNHGVPIWKNSDEETDILLEPHDTAMTPLALKVRCERVSENCGSYETFRDQMDEDMAKLGALGDIDAFYEGVTIKLVGFSGEPSAEDHEFKTQPQPQHFQAGEVHAWVTAHNLTPNSTGENKEYKALGSTEYRHSEQNGNQTEHENQVEHLQDELPIRSA